MLDTNTLLLAPTSIWHYSAFCRYEQQTTYKNKRFNMTEIHRIVVNGTEHLLDSSVDARVSLNDFIRDTCGLKGTKVMCREGGCGCCVLNVTKPGEHHPIAVNSCLVRAQSCDGWRVTTIEGLGNGTDGFHTIQEKLVQFNGSQCGFCTPAMVMSMYALYAKRTPVTQEQAESVFDGNLCRCTGYRSILDASKSLAANISCQDIEDLRIYNGSGVTCNNQCREGNCAQRILSDGTVWHQPKTMSQLLITLDKLVHSKVRIVAGNTSTGMFKDDGPYEAYIDTNQVPELEEITDVVGETFSLGANVSLSTMISTLKRISETVGFAYCTSIAKHLCVVASSPVRNIASWAGNLMTKYHHPQFASDVFILLAAVDAQVCIADTNSTLSVPVEKLFTVDMKGKIITKLTFKASEPGSVLQTYKITPRSQNAPAYTNAALFFDMDDACVVRKVKLLFGGVGNTERNFIRASKTETYLTNTSINNTCTVSDVLCVLESEVAHCAEFKRKLCCALLYKTFLALLNVALPSKLQSGAMQIHRPIMTGKREWETDTSKWPMTQPMTRVTAKIQASGEAEYVNDIPICPKTLHAAFVISTQGNATLDSVDASDALARPGVLRYICARDVPGINTISPPANNPTIPEPIFCDGKVYYAGQAIGLIVARTQLEANAAAKLVKVKYKNIAQPVTDIRQALEQKLFVKERYREVINGDAASAIRASFKLIEGEIVTGTQQHFPIENHACLCVPTEDYMCMYPTSQWIDGIQQGVAHALGITDNKVVVQVRRLGGGFGAKIGRNNLVSVPCAIAAYVMKAPVKIQIDLNTSMAMIGRRQPFLFKYKVGFTEEGKLNGIEMKYYSDCGYTDIVFLAEGALEIADNVYSCAHWNMSAQCLRTDTPANTYCRTPGKMKAVYFMECIIEHIAEVLQKDPLEIRMLNVYTQGQVSPIGEVFSFFKIKEMINNIVNSADVQHRKVSIAKFNKQNRWRKKGLSVVPTRWPVRLSWANYSAIVSVFNHDGSVAIAHGGIEMGQGINVKTIQTCAHLLGIPMSMVSVRPSQDLATANSWLAGASITSELCCLAVAKACHILLERIAPIKKGNPMVSWSELIAICHKRKVNLTAHHMVEESQYPNCMLPGPWESISYSTYGVTCAEVELDVLTGQRQINRVDILFDVGESANPMIDIGQIEGSLAMAIGFFLLEETTYDLSTGQNLSNNTRSYTIPTAKDMPVDLRIKMFNWAPNPLGIVRAKAVGEPPMLMGAAVVLALKHAIQAARTETGNKEHFVVNIPATVEKTFQLCLPNRNSYTLSE